ncbi:hypothetical protein Y032_0392g585 [Ancylostoma ceylanicum]|uniref:SNARE-complex protein Syntaxin-18 N-terminal domain-containing protein n=1 Tax=Ancylostoma ceylanicum TaxID=53326 RepID=A0A016RS32_9BILA|nr:hypothetical protein Y032_0392g585 [Ancylostoma ceylanicum]
MSIDHTAYFKAHAHTLAKQMDSTSESDSVRKTEHDVSPMYKKLISVAFSIARDLTELQQVVHSRRRGYLSFNSPFLVMGEAERDTFDRDTKKALSQLEHAIHRLSSQIAGVLTVKDEKKHLSLVVESLHNFLKRTAKMVTDMRAIRLRSTANQQKMLRLCCLVEAKQQRDNERDRVTVPSLGKHFSPDLSNTTLKWRGNKAARNEEHNVGKENEAPPSNDDSHNGWDIENIIADGNVQPDENEFSNPATLDNAQLMAENERMFERFSHVHAHIEGLETQITEIQRLQEAFAEKVMDQEKDIEIINEAALHTSENLKDGNEWIRQAISNSAGRRVVVLFCIIVITFTLLFLDWYNP